MKGFGDSNGSMDIYETTKMRVEIGSRQVVKLFKKRSGYRKRYKCEKLALKILEPIEGIPSLIEFSDEETCIIMTRLHGESGEVQENFSDDSLEQIRQMVERMLELGVARHSLPERDILINEDGSVKMVDFERVAIRTPYWPPWWKLSELVMRFQLYRFINRHNPLLLSEGELKMLERSTKVRSKLQGLKHVRDWVRRAWR